MCVQNVVPIGSQATTCIPSEGYTHTHRQTDTHTLSYIDIDYMYILLHTYTYAITVYVLLRCIAFFQRVYILCVYYNPLSMNLMYMPCSFLFIYLFTFIDFF